MTDDEPQDFDELEEKFMALNQEIDGGLVRLHNTLQASRGEITAIREHLGIMDRWASNVEKGASSMRIAK